MDGGVAVHQHGAEQGFFHMPKLQVPNYQKPRVFIPHNNNLGNPDGKGPPPDKPHMPTGNAPPGVTFLSGAEMQNVSFDGKRMRKAVVRKTVDYNTSVIKYLENRIWQRDWRDARAIQPDPLYHLETTPPMDMQHKPMNCLTTKFMRQSTNKFRCPIFCLAWTPEGRRLVTGASSGEFTLWNGLTFSFETILQAHETSVRAMVWSHTDQWMVTGDHGGYIKYWQSNMNNVKMYQGHKEAIRSISYCPTDSKFATCSDDGTVRVWDFLRCYEEKILRGHGADVKCVDWHPTKSLIASGSKDNQVPIKLWDPKSGTSLATLHAHKFTVMDVKWNQNGNWLLTAARDHLMKLFDLRNLKEELQVFKGHKKEATSIAWHPINEQMFASGGSDGAIMFWNAGTEKEVGAMEEAHDAIIWDLAWHPLGHVLASASNDHSTKFWSRNRPGDAMRDKYNLNIVAVGPDGEALDIDTDIPLGESKSLLPGMGLEFGLPPPEEEKPKKLPVFGQEEELPAIPGLDWQADAQYFKDQAKNVDDRPRKKTPYSRPIPRSFEQAWITNQQPGTLVKDENDGMMKRGKIQSLLSLDFPDKPPPGLEYVDLDGEEAEQRQPVMPVMPIMEPLNAPPGFGMPPIQTQRAFYEEERPTPEAAPSPGPRQDADYRGDQDYREDQDYRDEDQGFPDDLNFNKQFNNDGDNDYGYQGPREHNRHEASPGRGAPGHFRGHFRGGPPGHQGYHGDRNDNDSRFEEMDHSGQRGGPPQGGNRFGNMGGPPPGNIGGPPPGDMGVAPPGNMGGPPDQNMGQQGQGQFGYTGKGPMNQQKQQKGSGFSHGQFSQSNNQGNNSDGGMNYNNTSASPSRGGQGFDRGRGRHGDRGRGGQDGFRGRGRGGSQMGGNHSQGYNNSQEDSGGGWNSEGGNGKNDSFNENQGGRGGYQGTPNRGRGNFRGGDRGSRGGGRGGNRGSFRGGGGRGRGRGGRGGNQ